MAWRSRRHAARHLLAVADTGPGISPEDLPHIFDRFLAGREVGVIAAAGGSGLGLAITEHLVRAPRWPHPGPQ